MNPRLSAWVDERIDAAIVPDPGAKPDDTGPERRRRHAALAGVAAAVDVETRVREDAAAETARRAETAVWLGASLADLAAVTGHSRQAARKRWPGLGAVQRRRRWLGHHVDDVLWAARLVLEHADDLLPADLRPTLVGALADAVDAVAEAFAPRDATDDATDDDEAGTIGAVEPVARWRALDDLVDRRLRAVVDAADAADAAGALEGTRAGFAVHGARGVLAYLDHALSGDGRTRDEP